MPTEKVNFENLDKIITRARIKKDGRGGDFAAQKLRKELKWLFRFAVKLGWLVNNPVDFVEPITTKTDGFHAWTETEIAQFQSYWKFGTRERLAMEIMLWTAKRVGDVRELGPQHVKKGDIVTCDSKTSKPAYSDEPGH